ncbi:hypothetical protein MMMB2_1899 [Mycobacterium marinum MB2]|nr:hypothetical protein MMMB2_1899 [Mycobacterium marinum MB2]
MKKFIHGNMRQYEKLSMKRDGMHWRTVGNHLCEIVTVMN